MHHFLHISLKWMLTYFVSLESLISPVEFKIKLSSLEQHLATPHDLLLLQKCLTLTNEVQQESFMQSIKCQSLFQFSHLCQTGGCCPLGPNPHTIRTVFNKASDEPALIETNSPLDFILHTLPTHL